MIRFAFQRLETQSAIVGNVRKGFENTATFAIFLAFKSVCISLWVCILIVFICVCYLGALIRSWTRQSFSWTWPGQSLNETSCDSTCASGVRLMYRFYRKLVVIAIRVVRIGWNPGTVSSTSPAQNGLYCWLLDADCANKIYHNRFMKYSQAFPWARTFLDVSVRRSSNEFRITLSLEHSKITWQIIGHGWVTKRHLLNHYICFSQLQLDSKRAASEGPSSFLVLTCHCDQPTLSCKQNQTGSTTALSAEAMCTPILKKYCKRM